MAFSRPLLDPDHLLPGAQQREINPSDAVNFNSECPEYNAVPDVRVFTNSPGDDLPDYVSSSEQEDDGSDGSLVFVPGLGARCDTSLLIEDGERLIHQVMGLDPMGQIVRNDGEAMINFSFSSEEGTTLSFSSSILSSDNSGYEADEEEEEEEEEEEDDIRTPSPLDQEIPPENFWQGLHSFGASSPISPGVPVGPPVCPPVGPLVGPCSGPPGPPSILQSPEEGAPSASGLVSSSKKRRRVQNSPEQVSRKRQRRSDEDSAPSTSSGLRFNTDIRLWHSRSHHTRWSDESDSD